MGKAIFEANENAMTNQVIEIYDDEYANSYDERFLVSEYSKLSSDFELSILKDVLNKSDSWLDIGCGTGYYLSQFQHNQRCGIDISAAMLKIAISRNPTASFVEQDFRDFLSQTEEKWDFLSCMWTPYNYLHSMHEFDSFIQNMIQAVKEGGSIFLPVFDLEDLRPHTELEYRWDSDMPGYEGSIILTSSTWTWKEKVSKKTHTHLIAPQVDYFLEKLSGSFEDIRVLRYPVYQSDWVSRKAILCTNKRKEHVKSRISRDANPTTYNLHNNLKELGKTEAIKNLKSKDLLKLLLNRLMNKAKK